MGNNAAFRLFALAWRGERGSTVTEYAIIGALVSIMIVAGTTEIGEDIKAKLAEVLAGLQ